MRLLFAVLALQSLARADEPEKNVPAFTMTSQRVSTPALHLPQDFVESFDQPVASGEYRLCVGTDGHVARTVIIASVGKPFADEDVMKQLRETWTFKPRVQPVCFPQRVQFNIRHGRPGAE